MMGKRLPQQRLDKRGADNEKPKSRWTEDWDVVDSVRRNAKTTQGPCFFFDRGLSYKEHKIDSVQSSIRIF